MLDVRCQCACMACTSPPTSAREARTLELGFAELVGVYSRADQRCTLLDGPNEEGVTQEVKTFLYEESSN